MSFTCPKGRSNTMAKATATATAASELLISFAARGQSGAIPRIGFGTATIKEQDCVEAVVTALKAGYRHLDTALLYGNQVAVGEGIRKSGIPREEIWVTTKVAFFPPKSDGVWMHSASNEKGKESSSIDTCLEQLGLDYVDLLLIHNPATNREEYTASSLPHFFELFNHSGHPNAIKPDKLPTGEKLRDMILDSKLRDVRPATDVVASYNIRKESWLALEKAKKDGKCKFIGVSNYPAALLEEMKDYQEIAPAVNQLELHPWFSSPSVQEKCAELGIVVTAYGSGNSAILNADNATVLEVAKKHGITPVQVVLKWTSQHGIVVIPRSRSEEHTKENFAAMKIPDFSLDDMSALDKLNKGYPYYWCPKPVLATLQ